MTYIMTERHGRLGSAFDQSFCDVEEKHCAAARVWEMTNKPCRGTKTRRQAKGNDDGVLDECVCACAFTC
jgi:hypothetical protein